MSHLLINRLVFNLAIFDLFHQAVFMRNDFGELEIHILKKKKKINKKNYCFFLKEKYKGLILELET